MTEDYSLKVGYHYCRMGTMNKQVQYNCEIRIGQFIYCFWECAVTFKNTISDSARYTLLFDGHGKIGAAVYGIT